MLLKLPHNLSGGRAPVVGVLGPIFCFKNEASWRMLNIIFSSSMIFFAKNILPNRPKTP